MGLPFQSSLLAQQPFHVSVELLLVVERCFFQDELLVGLLVLQEGDVPLGDPLQLVETAHKFPELHVLLAELVTHRFELKRDYNFVRVR